MPGYQDGVVAIVNDDVITVYDVAKFNADFEKQIQQRYAASGENDADREKKRIEEINRNRIEAANELINQKLIYAEFLKKGFQLPVEIVEKRMDALVTTHAGGDWKEFEKMVLESGTTLQELREKIEKQLAVDLLISQTIDRNIQVSPKEVEQYFAEHRDEFISPLQVRLQIIERSMTDGGGADAVSAATDIVYQALGKNEAFESVAKTYSLHANAATGGDLGWMNAADLRQEFRDGLETLGRDVVSKPIVIDGHVYILRIAELRGGDNVELSQMEGQIKRKLQTDKRQQRYAEYVDELRRQAYVRVFYKEL